MKLAFEPYDIEMFFSHYREHQVKIEMQYTEKIKELESKIRAQEIIINMQKGKKILPDEIIMNMQKRAFGET